MIKQVPRRKAFERLSKFIKNPLPFLMAHADRYGSTYIYYLGGLVRSFVSIDPDFIQQVLKKNHKNYEKSVFQTERLAKYIGHGLLTSKGKYWLKQRRLIQPGFHKDRLKNIAHLMQEEIDLFFASWQKGQQVELVSAMNELAFRIVARTLFSTGIQNSDLYELAPIVTELQAYIINKERQPYLKWWFALSGMEKRKRKRAKQAQRILLDFIHQRKQDTTDKNDLLDMLLATRYEDGSSMTDAQLVDECLILFVAGHETSANALSWSIIEISRHAEVMHTLRSESQNTSDDLWQKLSELQYTEQVLNETMRMYPPAWAIDRSAIAADTYKGHDIKAGDMVLLLVYGLHRNPNLWEAPDKFDPDRFGPNRSIPKQAFMPFGLGPRYCIGQSFAMMEIKLALSAFIEKFTPELNTTGIGILPQISLRPDRNVIVTLI